MYQLNKFKKLKHELFKDQKIRSQDILQIFILLMLVIILYYVNWIKWISNDNTFEKFISLDKPELESIIRFDSDQLSSLSSSERSSSKRSSSKESEDKNLFLDSNHSFKYSSHETINLPLSDSSYTDEKGNELSNLKSKTNSNLINSRNKLNLNPTKATSLQSLQSSNYTDHNSNLDLNNDLNSDSNSDLNNDLNSDSNNDLNSYLNNDSNSVSDTNSDNAKQHNDLSSNKQMDHSNFQIRKDANLAKGELDQQELKKSEISEFAVDSTIEQSSTSHSANLHSIHVLSSKFKVELRIDNQMIYQSISSPSNRGFHVFVLNQHNLNLMSHRVFDTYSSSSESDQLNDYLLNKVSKNRLLIFAVQDEASFALSNETIELMQGIGCKLCVDLGWRDMYTMLTLNSFDSKLLIREQLSKNDHVKSWAQSVELDLQLDLENLKPFTSCKPPYDYLDEPAYFRERRAHFCEQIDGYLDSICNCDHPTQLLFDIKPIPEPHRMALINVPVAVIAANRPYYLHSMLNSLLTANGVNRSMITIYIDGFFKEPYELAKLFGLRVVQHKPVGKANARISQHYYFSLNELFNHYSTSEFAIIFEEDLITSPDVFQYFSQTKNLLVEDPSIYCISAFNDNSYVHSSSDESLCYRVEGMPGLGWMLTRRLWENELRPNWPGPRLRVDWDLYIRQDKIRKNRECIVPDVSRTYHLGIKGINMNRDFHNRYFENRALNQIDYVNLTDVDRLIELNYELHLLDLIKKGKVINEQIDVDSINDQFRRDNDNDEDDNLLYNESKSFNRDKLVKFKNEKQDEKSFCNQLLNYFQQLNTSDQQRKAERPAQILYINMEHESDFNSWLSIATCFSLWDLNGDPRGMHKGLWRFFLNDHHVLVIGSPSSPYSVFKKSHVKPILINS